MEMDIKRYNIPNNHNEAATMTRDTFNKKLLVLKVCAKSLECFILEGHQFAKDHRSSVDVIYILR